MKTVQRFKQTEIGEIPEDWELITFEKAFNFLSTATYSRDQLSDNKEIFYVHYGDIHTKMNYFLDFNKITLSTIENEDVKGHTLIKEGDLIIVDASEDYEGISKSVEVKNIGSKKAISGLHTFLLRQKNNFFIDGFKAYIQSNKLVKNQLDRLATGMKVYGVSKTNLKLVQIPCPTIEEQSAIASILSDTDTLIESLDKLIVKKKNIKQGAMQELLTGKRRLPGFKEEWEVKTLGKVANFEHGYGLSKADLNEDGNHKCIHYGQLFTEYKELIQDIKSKTNISSNIVYSQDNDVLMPTSDVTPRGLATASCIKEKGVILGGGILVIRLHSDYDGLYLSYFVTQNKNSILKLVKGSTVFHLYSSDLTNLEISFPKYEEQKVIAQILSDMDSEIEQLEQKRDKYKQIKNGMMQELLTGRIRIYATN